MAHNNPANEHTPARSWRSRLLMTILCFTVSLCIVTIGRGALHVLEQALPTHNKIEGFQLADFCFAHGHEEARDTDIVIVDCTTDTRDELADKLNRIAGDNPAVIGVDVLFLKELPAAANARLLATADSLNHKIVWAHTEYTSFYHQMLAAGLYHKLGFVEWINSDLTKRDFSPFHNEEHQSTDTFFAVQVAMAAGRNLPGVEQLDAGRRYLINFRNGFHGHRRYSVVYDINSAAAFHNKIVLLGGFDTTTQGDMHFTPLNGRINRPRPDMFGIEFQAQVISMLLTGDYIYPLHPVIKYLLLFCCCFLVVLLDGWLSRWHRLHHILMHLVVILGFTALFLIVCVTGLQHGVVIEPMDYLLPMIFSINIIPLYDIFAKGVYRVAKRIVYVCESE